MTAVKSRVDSYVTLMPVWSSNGLSTAIKLDCSCPDHSASTDTVPGPAAVLEPQATATNMAPSAAARTRPWIKARIVKSPTCGEQLALPVSIADFEPQTILNVPW